MNNNELFHLARSIEDDSDEIDNASLLDKPKLASKLLVKAVRLMNELVRREIERDGQQTGKS